MKLIRWLINYQWFCHNSNFISDITENSINFTFKIRDKKVNLKYLTENNKYFFKSPYIDDDYRFHTLFMQLPAKIIKCLFIDL